MKLTVYDKEFYITFCDDCDDNEGGYFCQVYLDAELDDEIDCFCIHPNEYSNEKELKAVIKRHIKEIK